MSRIYVQITATRGSAPRDAGTAMCVTQTGLYGTIGGGALEHLATTTARQMLTDNTPDTTRTLPLGPNLGQCCGGSVTLHFTRTRCVTDTPLPQPALPITSNIPRIPLWIWGAGHVGRAMVKHAVPTRAFDITWIDAAPDRFPEHRHPAVTTLPTPDMPLLAKHASQDAHHLILTYSHDIDLALCATLLQRGFVTCGLIGSATKWTRFQTRLKARALDPTAITCPIGDPRLGKHPDQIASGTLRALLAYTRQKEMV